MVTIGRVSSSGSPARRGGGRSRSRDHHHHHPQLVSASWLLSHLCVGLLFFYGGFWLGTATSTTTTIAGGGVADDGTTTTSSTNRINTAPARGLLLSEEEPTKKNAAEAPDDASSIFAKSVRGGVVAGGSATVSRADFIEQFDVGVPWDEMRDDVLLLYGSHAARPSSWSQYNNSHYDSSVEATENCHALKVILTKPNNQNANNECIALVGQWSSFHLHHFLRLRRDDDDDNHKDNQHNKKDDKDGDAPPPPLFQPDYPFRYVSRRHDLKGKTPQLPRAEQTRRYWPVLVDYLQKLDATLERLRPVAARAAQVAATANDSHKKNANNANAAAVVVMVCNWGQSELLANFVCAARSRGLSLANILLFATDAETYRFAQSLGITAAFDVRDAFGDDMPKDAARQYGDKRFTGMMLAKVYCVHLVNALGYDVLFQDVDVVWYRDPLPYFHSPDSKDFDFYFQDDGAHSNRYAPYSPNSGFYYVRHNDRTRYFFDVFARMGELILASGSHQSVLNDLLTEQASSKGLKVKVFQRDSKLGNDFPGGFHYHSRKNFMKDMIQGKKKPYIFHMSWTTNKENKRKFFQQMGDWFVKDVCLDRKAEDIFGSAGGGDDLSKHCCSAEPLVQCHYRDKPSKIPCKDSDPIDQGRRSFW